MATPIIRPRPGGLTSKVSSAPQRLDCFFSWQRIWSQRGTRSESQSALSREDLGRPPSTCGRSSKHRTATIGQRTCVNVDFCSKKTGWDSRMWSRRPLHVSKGRTSQCAKRSSLDAFSHCEQPSKQDELPTFELEVGWRQEDRMASCMRRIRIKQASQECRSNTNNGGRKTAMKH